MATIHNTLLLYCESSMHAGTGQGIGTIDLPIQRERHSGFPKIEASALRGAIREAVWEGVLYQSTDDSGKINKSNMSKVFGNNSTGDQRSAIEIGDARILFFPVRSWKGVFAWITCPYVLNRYVKDMSLPDKKEVPFSIPILDDNSQVLVATDSMISSRGQVMLEEYVFDVKKSTDGTSVIIDDQDVGLYVANQMTNGAGASAMELLFSLTNRWAVVTDEVFADFVLLYSEKITRNKIDSDSGTAEDGGLFTEEFLPSDSILYAYIGATNEFSTREARLSDRQVMDYFLKYLPKILQVGGEANIGKGLTRTAIVQQ